MDADELSNAEVHTLKAFDTREEFLEAFGVTQEEIERLDPSYIAASADAKREREETAEVWASAGREIAAELTFRLRARGVDGRIQFKTERLDYRD